eukprot:gene2722-3379_t
MIKSLSSLSKCIKKYNLNSYSSSSTITKNILVSQQSLSSSLSLNNRKQFYSSSPSSSSLQSQFLKRGKEREITNLKEGDIVHGFQVKKVQDVPERQFKTFTLEHIKTGAKYLHVDCEDKNNVFSVTFKTTPKDSTGVAHILEHTTLCGSKKYPVRDPFFNMLKRSLNTYMNAWTAPDHTSYPFGTQDEKDFYNLLSVYLDATFFPLLKEQDFRQEGHRLEFENLESPETPLKFKGIVFNEMKGALSDPSSFFQEVAQQHLYPGTTYAHNSGGEPTDIPNLTYDQLKSFHAKYYHPSNAFFFTYGDLPLEKHLEFIEKNGLSSFEKDTTPETKFKKVQRWTEPKSIELTCPPSAMEVNPERKFKYSISLLHKESAADPFESLSMHTLSHLLLRGSNTPMYQALLESGLALDYTPNTGYDDNLYESSFSIGAVGVKKEDLEKVEKVIIETLEKAEKEGFDPQVIESFLHQYEFAQKDVSASFGLKLAGALAPNWIHGGDPVEPLFLNQNIQRLRKELESGPFFQKKIRELLDNKHKLVITMQPDENHQKSQELAEQEKLEKIKSQLSQQQIDEIVANSKELQERQNQIQDVSVLPKINICDIEKRQERLDHVDTEIGSTPLRILDFPTNGITYFRTTIDISTLPEELKPYIPLYCSLFDEMGAGQFNHKQLETEINLSSGKFSTMPLINNSPSSLHETKEQIYLKSACLNRNLDKMFSLWNTILFENKWKNPDLLKILLAQRQSSMIDNIPSAGLSYARINSASRFSRSGTLNEIWGGLSQVNFTNDIVAKNDLDSIIEKLIQINQFILDRSLMQCLITTEKDNIERATSSLGNFLKPFSFNNTPVTTHPIKSVDTSNPLNFFVIPATVNYISRTYLGVPYTDKDSVPLQVLSKVLSEYLHKEIREKGGAYGGGVSLDRGNISFYSYRDPNFEKTLNAFDESIQWSTQKDNITTEYLENAQLSIFSDFDSPQSPSNKGVSEWLSGINNDMKQERRTQLLTMTKNQLVDASQKYLNNNNQSFTTVLGKQRDSIGPEWKYQTLSENK